VNDSGVRFGDVVEFWVRDAEIAHPQLIFKRRKIRGAVNAIARDDSGEWFVYVKFEGVVAKVNSKKLEVWKRCGQ
jgi:hypothetical protein